MFNVHVCDCYALNRCILLSYLLTGSIRHLIFKHSVIQMTCRFTRTTQRYRGISCEPVSFVLVEAGIVLKRLRS